MLYVSNRIFILSVPVTTIRCFTHIQFNVFLSYTRFHQLVKEMQRICDCAAYSMEILFED